MDTGVVDTSIREIHDYPLRPEGFQEPLFLTPEARREVLEHLAGSDWLFRASECGRLKSRVRGANVAPVNRIGRVLASWREVDRWWEPDGGIDAIWRLVELDSGREEVWAEAPVQTPESTA